MNELPTPPTPAPDPAPAPPPPAAGPLKVIAVQPGYYGEKRRRTGDVFSLLEPGHFSTTWMRIVAATTPEKITNGQQELRRQHDEILASRTPGATSAPDAPTGDADSLDADSLADG